MSIKQIYYNIRDKLEDYLQSPREHPEQVDREASISKPDKYAVVKNFFKKNWMFFVVVVAGFLISAYIVGNFVSATRNLIGQGPKRSFIYHAFSVWPATVLVWGVLVMVFCFFLYSHRRKDGYSEEYKTQFRKNDGSYGTALMMNEDDPRLRECLNLAPLESDDSAGVIVGMAENGDAITTQLFQPNVRMKLPNSHMCISGPTGSGKSRCIGFNFIFQSIRRGESFITTDTSGELYRDTSEIAREEGYVVRLLDYRPHMAMYSDSFNAILQVVRGSPIKAMALATILSDTESTEKDFWYKAQKNALTAVILIVDSMTIPREEKSLAKVYEICTEGSKALSIRFNALDKRHPAYFNGQVFVNSEQKAKDSAISGICIMLQVYSDQTIRHISSYDDVDIRLPGDEKCAYYVTISDNQSTLTFLSSVFFNFLFSELIELASKNLAGRLRVPVNIMMDEFVSIGIISDFVRKEANVRKYGITLCLLFQDIPMLKETYGGNYGDLWQSILSNCAINIVLACNEIESTADHYSKVTGLGTIETDGKRVNRSALMPKAPHLLYTENETVTSRSLLNPDEVMRIEEDEELVFLHGMGVAKLKKFDYSNHYMYKRIKKVLTMDHIPDWWQYHPEYQDDTERISVACEDISFSKEDLERMREESSGSMKDKTQKEERRKQDVDYAKQRASLGLKISRNEDKKGNPLREF